jgi:glycosyltransferase involved in cell wall biosynthesis
MSPPSICIISHSHPDFSKGGGELSAYRQFLTQRSEGWNAVFVAASDVNTTYAATKRIDQIVAHEEAEYLYEYSGMDTDLLSWKDGQKRRAFVRFLAGLGSDIYHFHHYWRVGIDLIYDLMEARPDARFVLTVHEMLAICLHHGQMVKTRGNELCNRASPMRCLSCFPNSVIEQSVMRKAYLLTVMRRMDHILYPSHFIQKRYEDWGLRGTSSSVLENYLGDDLLARPRIAADAQKMSTRFGFFGNPTEFKGLNILLSGFALALRERSDITLTIFGAVREDVLRFFPTLASTIDGMEQNVFFSGRYDPADSPSLMGSVGWIVVPSIWWENSPVVIQEAQRSGTPLIVSDIGGMAEKVLPEVDGMHFRRASPVDLARVIGIAAQPDTRARYGRSIRDTIGKEEFLEGLRLAYGSAAAQEAPAREAVAG